MATDSMPAKPATVVLTVSLVSAMLLFVWILIADPMIPDGLSCDHGDSEPCPDLLLATIRIVEEPNRDALSAICGDQRSDACALRRFRYDSAECTIHLWTKAPSSVLEHEMNHCRGWDHAGDTYADYRSPWHINRKGWLLRGMYLGRNIQRLSAH